MSLQTETEKDRAGYMAGTEQENKEGIFDRLLDDLEARAKAAESFMLYISNTPDASATLQRIMTRLEALQDAHELLNERHDGTSFAAWRREKMDRIVADAKATANKHKNAEEVG